MRILNYSERAFLVMMTCSSLFTSLFWLLVMWQVTHTTKTTYSVALAWLSITFVQMVLGLYVGSRVSKRTLLEMRLKLRLKKLKEERVFREKKNHRINDHLIEGVIILNEQSRVLSTNRAARRMFRLNKGAKNRSIAEVIREPEFHELVLMAQQKKQSLEKSVCIGGGARRIFFFKAIPLKNGELMLTALDITRTSTIDEKHNNFIAHASHELKTPISVVLANAELLIDTKKHNSPDHYLLQAILRQAVRAKNLLDSLLELLRLDASPTQAPLEAIHLKSFVDDIKESLGQCGDMISNEVLPQFLVRANGALLERLSLIIIENAQKYAGPKARLLISAQQVKDRVRIRFFDDGPGIKRHLREKVFERFYRQPEHESSEKEGFGLGLSRARAIASSLGGKILIDDTHSGCAIVLYLKSVNQLEIEPGLPAEYFDAREIT